MIEIDSVLNKISAIPKELEQSKYLGQIVNIIEVELSLYFVEVYLVDLQRQIAIASAWSEKFTPFLSKLNRVDPIKIETNCVSQAGSAIYASQIRLRKWGASEILSYSLPPVTSPNLPKLISKERVSIPFLSPEMPLTKCELCLPIRTDTKIVGALVIQSDQLNEFDDVNKIRDMQTIADKMGTFL